LIFKSVEKQKKTQIISQGWEILATFTQINIT